MNKPLLDNLLKKRKKAKKIKIVNNNPLAK